MKRIIGKCVLLAGVAFALVCGGSPAFAAQPVPRTILALYNSQREQQNLSQIHRFVEMPLNQLGLRVRYHDVNKPLPDIATLSDVRGFITWFSSATVDDPSEYIQWALDATQSGKPYLVIGNFGFLQGTDGRVPPGDMVALLLKRIGLVSDLAWQDSGQTARIVTRDPELYDFEYELQQPLPPYYHIEPADKTAHSVLVVSSQGLKSHVVLATKGGGYVGEGFAHHRSGDDNRLWYLNIFKFLRTVFKTGELPKPDVSTLAGRRVYFSHIDGDGWNSLLQYENTFGEKTITAMEIYKKAIKPYPDLPVTVGPVAGDIDPTMHGIPASQEAVKKLFALDHVEGGSHTYTHPFDWGFYKDFTPEKELRFSGPRDPETGRLKKKRRFKYDNPVMDGMLTENPDEELGLYAVPRAYFDTPFSLKQEIAGSVAYLNSFMPQGKTVQLVQWSGDTSPYPEALAFVRELGLNNLNGGDSRFDAEFPSYSFVSPVGIMKDGEIQSYTGNSNENTYTELWTARFFGLKLLTTTLENTETPMRVRPFNLYYHMYSGERPASLNAVLYLLDYARKRADNLCPVAASRYARMAKGFFTTELVRLGKDLWRVENRGSLQTMRFDEATLKAVDISRSRGVIGQRHYQGSLYVALDAAASTPVIALKEHIEPASMPHAPRPYLVHSRWPVRNVLQQKDRVVFTARGFGQGKMQWKLPARHSGVRVFVKKQGEKIAVPVQAAQNGTITFMVAEKALEPVEVTIIYK